MADVKCARCQKSQKGLDEAPFKNELGQMVLKQTCENCWNDWVSQQLMLMNEYRLDPLNDEHGKYLDNEMVKFLNFAE